MNRWRDVIRNESMTRLSKAADRRCDIFATNDVLFPSIYESKENRENINHTVNYQRTCPLLFVTRLEVEIHVGVVSPKHSSLVHRYLTQTYCDIVPVGVVDFVPLLLRDELAKLGLVSFFQDGYSRPATYLTALDGGSRSRMGTYHIPQYTLSLCMPKGTPSQSEVKWNSRRRLFSQTFQPRPSVPHTNIL
jgi:hypothetical protein